MICPVAMTMSIDRSAHEKRRQLQVMLDAGLVMIHLDPRGPEVIVPQQFKEDHVLRLSLAWGFKLPALDIGVDGVYAVLSFNRQNFGCTLPWGAIFAMTAPDAGHEGVVWPESVPPELAPYFQAAGVTGGAVPVSLRAEERRGHPDDEETVPRPAPAVSARPAPEPAPRPLFIVHEGGKSDATLPAGEPSAEGDADATPAEPPKRPNLRLIKG